MVTLKYLCLHTKLQDITCHIHHHDSHQSKIILQPVLCASQETSADCNIPAVSALLLSLLFKFVPIFNKHSDDASIWNLLFHFLHSNTRDKLSPQLSKRIAIDYTRYIGKGRVIEHAQLLHLHSQLFLRPYLGSQTASVV